MGVIYLPSWRVFCFIDEAGDNVIRQWLDREAVAEALRGTMQGLIDFIQAGGPSMVPGCIVPVPRSKQFHFLEVQRKGLAPIRAVLCYGPFGDTELTLLVGVPDRQRLLVKPTDALGVAQENFRAVDGDYRRRRYERVIGPLTRRPTR